MSECVVRMEIPVNCDKCDLRNGCKLYVDYTWSLSDCFPTRPKPNPLDKGCLIICQLPEGHGRLVDIDKPFLEVMQIGHMVQIIVPAEAERSETEQV